MTVEQRTTAQQPRMQQLDVIIDLQRRQLALAARTYRFFVWVFWIFLGVPTIILLLVYGPLSTVADTGGSAPSEIPAASEIAVPGSGPPTGVVIMLLLGGIMLAGALAWLVIERFNARRHRGSALDPAQVTPPAERGITQCG